MIRNHPLVTEPSRVPALFLSTEFKFRRIHQSSFGTVWAQAPAESLVEIYKMLHLAHADSTSMWGQGPWTISCESKTHFTVLFLLFSSPLPPCPLLLFHNLYIYKQKCCVYKFGQYICIYIYIYIQGLKLTFSRTIQFGYKMFKLPAIHNIY